jgi:two-component system, chemotaxis family, chemotaxis protein CheY
MQFLIVDDSKAMRMIVTRVLRQAGYVNSTIREACDGTEALAAVSQEIPDLIVSDWNMPEMSGIDLLRALRSQGCEVPFGFVTSESTPEMREKANEAGAQFLIAKPFTPDSFAEVLSAVVG